jgi:hypothetical protein
MNYIRQEFDMLDHVADNYHVQMFATEEGAWTITPEDRLGNRHKMLNYIFSPGNILVTFDTFGEEGDESGDDEEEPDETPLQTDFVIETLRERIRFSANNEGGLIDFDEI